MRFLHLADAHLDRPFSGIADMPDSMAKLCLRAAHNSLDRAVELAIEREVDAVLVAGDLFDAARRGVEASLFLRDRLGRLSSAGISTFMIHGNHDPLDQSLTRVSWPAGVHVFPTDDVYQMALHDKNGTEAHIYGISFHTSEVKENLASRFPKERTAEVMVGLLHANVGGRSGHENYAPCTESHLSSKAIDYWALGHIHKREVFLEDRPKAAYPGVLQGANVGEAGEGGGFIVDIKPEGPVKMEFVPLSEISWLDISVDIGPLADVGDLEDSILAQIDSSDNHASIIRVTVAGRGPMHHELAHKSDQEGFLEALRAAASDLGELWISEVANITQPELDLQALQEEETFIGEMLRAAQRLKTEEKFPEDLIERLNALHANPSFSRLLDSPESLDWQNVIDRAQIVVLDRLLKDRSS